MILKDKKILVTGGSSGIGQAIAIALANQGAIVAITYNENEKGAGETLSQLGNSALKLRVDMQDESQIREQMQILKKEWNILDVLVNNAGVNKPRGLFSPADWKEIFQVNLFSAVLITGLAVDMMTEGGKILNITSIYGDGKACESGLAPYGAAKSAFNHYTEVLAKNLAPKILVNAIAPGYVRTPLWGNHTDAEFVEYGKEQLIERMITPEEIAQMAVAVIQNDAMTGEIVRVDGGLSLKTV